MTGSKLAVSLAFAGSLLLLCQSLEAATDPPMGQPAAGPIKNDTGKRVCREVTPTGTRFSKRVCRTPEEWQKDSDDAQRHLDEADRSYRVQPSPCGIGCGPQ